MTMSQTYVEEKLSTAVADAASMDAPLVERAFAVALRVMAVDERDFLPALRDRWAPLSTQLGRITATIDRSPDGELRIRDGAPEKAELRRMMQELVDFAFAVASQGTPTSCVHTE